MRMLFGISLYYNRFERILIATNLNHRTNSRNERINCIHTSFKRYLIWSKRDSAIEVEHGNGSRDQVKLE